MDDVTTVAYDLADKGWVATRAGEELGRNHRLGPENELGARKWLAWLTGQSIPLSPGEQAALEAIQADSALGASGPYDLLLAHFHAQPGLVTDEYTQSEISLLHALVCTSLPDDQVLERARSSPSGTSGGWVCAPRAAERCQERSDTHRHIFLEAG